MREKKQVSPQKKQVSKQAAGKKSARCHAVCPHCAGGICYAHDGNYHTCNSCGKHWVIN